jgi:ketosteroid isomerase-like protein
VSASEDQAVIAATRAFYAALNAMLAGDPDPLADVYSHADDVTYMPAEGGFLFGWEAVSADWSRQAQASRGGAVEAEDIQVTVGAEIAISGAYTGAKMTAPDGEVREVRLRESSAFRREDGEWKMIAHHADDLSVWEDVVKSG